MSVHDPINYDISVIRDRVNLVKSSINTYIRDIKHQNDNPNTTFPEPKSISDITYVLNIFRSQLHENMWGYVDLSSKSQLIRKFERILDSASRRSLNDIEDAIESYWPEITQILNNAYIDVEAYNLDFDNNDSSDNLNQPDETDSSDDDSNESGRSDNLNQPDETDSSDENQSDNKNGSNETEHELIYRYTFTPNIINSYLRHIKEEIETLKEIGTYF